MKLKMIIGWSMLLGSLLSIDAKISSAEYASLYLTQVGSYQNGCILLSFPPGDFNAGGYLVIDPTQPGAKQMLAIAMTALTSGKSVTVDRQTGTPGVAPIASGCWGIGDYADDLRLNSK
jgi:hypothetical protein